MLVSLALDVVRADRTVTGLDFTHRAARHVATGARRDLVDFDAVVDWRVTLARGNMVDDVGFRVNRADTVMRHRVNPRAGLAEAIPGDERVAARAEAEAEAHADVIAVVG